MTRFSVTHDTRRQSLAGHLPLSKFGLRCGNLRAKKINQKIGDPLTSKAISTTFSQHEKAGVVQCFALDGKKPNKRRLYWCGPALVEIAPNSKNPSMLSTLGGRGSVLAAVRFWVSGGHIFRSGKRAFLKPLTPPPQNGVWEIRVTDPRPQFRILGVFAEKDTFCAFRIHSRGHLGDKGSYNWNEAINGTAKAWKALMGDVPYLTENQDDLLFSEC